MKELSVVTFNLRLNTPRDGANCFMLRRPLISSAIERRHPDILCFQEVLPDMLDWLYTTLDGYGGVGYGRGSDFGDEANPVFYRHDRIELQSFGQFALSPTPSVPGSRYPGQSPCPRIYVRTRMRDLDSGERFYLYNTHLDHADEQSRQLGIELILDEMSRDQTELPLPAIVTGDFNALPSSPVITAVSSRLSPHLKDATASLPVSFHGFGHTAEKIDYIFLPDTAVYDVSVWEDRMDALYLSDHNPLEARIHSL